MAHKIADTEYSGPACPLPLNDHPRVIMAHGSGGRLMGCLIDDLFRAAFTEVQPQDSAVLDLPASRIAMTTDSFVVHPLFFPGGDIGSLAVHGTINDLAMAGAKPLYMSVSFILEEGLEMEMLWRVVQSMRDAAHASGIAIVTGDTKVVERGHGDGLYINTTGIGEIIARQPIAPDRVRSGDTVLLSGDIGRHGMAVMAQREGLRFESAIESDSAPLAGIVREMIEFGVKIHCLRDATRGGVAAVLNEIASASGLQIAIQDGTIPVEDGVRGACEILGLDPLHIANEGRFIAFTAPEDADKALEILRAHNESATIIGTVTTGKAGRVTLQTSIGGTRILDLPAGEILPRIC